MANPYFNAAYYLANNQDLVIAGYTEANAEEHYNEFGAAEGRAPNSWFNGTAYLLANPDLIANGITLSTALEHFAQYGVYEGRIFSDNPSLAPSNFDATTYAEDNADVAEAYGIDPADITPAQAADLLAHYLAYGLNEGRKGAGTEFEEAAREGELIEVVGSDDVNGYVNVGTSGDDTFVWTTDWLGDNANVNGLAGNDTLKVSNPDAWSRDITLNLAAVENIEIGEEIDSVEVTGTGVEKITLTKDAGDVEYIGRNVASYVLNGDHTLTLYLDGVDGTSDSISATINDDGALWAYGVEEMNVTLGANAVAAYLWADEADGSTVTFNLTGGKAGNVVELGFDSEDSAELESATIDATGVLSDISLDADGDILPSLQNVDITIKAGAGDDVIDMTGTFAGKKVTINAGAGDDEIYASDGVDTITGGAGKDGFYFGEDTATAKVNADGEITAVDTITDFKLGTDVLLIEELSAVADVAVADFYTSEEGLVTFATGFLTGKALEDVVSALSDEIAATEGAVFSFKGETYVFVSGGTAGDITDDGLIKLAGVKAADVDVADFVGAPL